MGCLNAKPRHNDSHSASNSVAVSSLAVPGASPSVLSADLTLDLSIQAASKHALRPSSSFAPHRGSKDEDFGPVNRLRPSTGVGASPRIIEGGSSTEATLSPGTSLFAAHGPHPQAKPFGLRAASPGSQASSSTASPQATLASGQHNLALQTQLDAMSAGPSLTKLVESVSHKKSVEKKAILFSSSGPKTPMKTRSPEGTVRESLDMFPTEDIGGDSNRGTSAMLSNQHATAMSSASASASGPATASASGAASAPATIPLVESFAVPDAHVDHFAPVKRPSSTTDKSHMQPLSGVSIGQEIGRGSLGVVYQGLMKSSGMLVAVKRIPLSTLISEENRRAGSASPEKRNSDGGHGGIGGHTLNSTGNGKNSTGNGKELEGRISEISVHKTLDHPNIVKMLGHEMAGEYLYIIMEYVPSGSLSKLIKSCGALEEGTVKIYTRQILSGLAYLHNQNVMHRDIKCANILIAPSGECKLSDFGCAKNLDSTAIQSEDGSPRAAADRRASDGANSIPGQSNIAGQSNTKRNPLTYTVAGSVPWMAPEVLGKQGHGKQADIWAIGCTVIEMLTGSNPWGQFDNTFAAILKICASPDGPKIPTNDGSGKPLSESCVAFIKSCLLRDANMRPSAEELLKHRFLSSQI